MRLEWAGILLGLFQLTTAFYIPWLSPRKYSIGQRVSLYVNKITSVRTQLPYSFNDLPFVCKLENGNQNIGLNLGEILRGDRIARSGYILEFGKDIECAHLCDRVLTPASAAMLDKFIKEEYLVEWLVDSLPAATSFVTVDRKRKYYGAGFKLGYLDRDEVYVNNHVTMVIKYRSMEDDPEKMVIVAFEAYPRSVDGPPGRCVRNLDSTQPKAVQAHASDQSTTLTYTYSIYWREDTTIEWSKRWDLYFVNSDPQIHFYSLINSCAIALLLTVVVAIVLFRALSRDIQHYNSEDHAGDKEILGGDKVMTGWKLVSSDVFRSPAHATLFSALAGAGVQMLVMTIALFVFFLMGILNSSYRGGFVSFAIFLFAFAGAFSGYTSTRLFLAFNGNKADHWRQNAVNTGLFIPGCFFGTTVGLNFFLWAKSSSSALPFGTIFAILCIWLFISVPLVYVGGWMATAQTLVDIPRRPSLVARQIPTQPFYLSLPATIFFGGLLPFAVIFVELLFVLRSVWQDQSTYYYQFSYVAFSTIIVIVSM